MYILLFAVVTIIETEDTIMNTRRKHPATPDRKSERDGVGRDGRIDRKSESAEGMSEVLEAEKVSDAIPS